MTQADLLATLPCDGWHGPLVESAPFQKDGYRTVNLLCCRCGEVIVWTRQIR